MKLRIEIDDRTFVLDFETDGTEARYTVEGVQGGSGTASLAESVAGTYSVLLRNRSFTVHSTRVGDGLELWAEGRRYFVCVGDPRDRSAKSKGVSKQGSVDVRTQMPGKVIKVLAEAGKRVSAGEPLVVVEAMKMQNELRSPKEGVVARMYAVEGATVEAGERLIVID
ncbi:MAG: hypothetical protein JOZ62_03595 [Acidobacteriaceae bacterium]|nr:hypothetical protein [Acidobacteriaceae bacterium]